MAASKKQSGRNVKTQKSATPKNNKAKRKKATTRSKKAEVRFLSKNKGSVVEIPKRKRRKRRTNAQIEADLPQHKCETCDFCQFKHGRYRCIRNKDYPVNIYLNKCKLHSLEVATAIFGLPRNDEGVILAS